MSLETPVRWQTSTEGESLDRLYAQIAALQMTAGWNRSPPLLSGPAFVPHHWRYAAATAALDAAGRLIDTDIAERRNLVLVNPADGVTYATVPTMIAAYQMLLPGESARSHRHTPNALRLILDSGPGAYTIVDGEKLPMLPGDVLLTPSWCWHAHVHEGDRPAYWLDVLDVPLIENLGLRLFESHPRRYEDRAAMTDGSPMRLCWSDTQRRLDQIGSGAEAASVVQVDLTDPALPSLGLSMLRLSAGGEITLKASMTNQLLAIVRGACTMEVGGQAFACGRGDLVAVTAGHTHALHAQDDLVLFRVTDAPLMRLLAPRTGRDRLPA